jgi:hypothetical protein
MTRRRAEESYPRIAFHPKSHGWWARLSGTPPECAHLEQNAGFAALYVPDRVYLRGKARARRRPERPEVSLCAACLLGELRPELAQFAGRVVAFEPDAPHFTQYFFVAQRDFDAAGLEPQLSAAMGERLASLEGRCEQSSCAKRATWLWLDREAVPSLDDALSIRAAPGKRYCAGHGAAALCTCLGMVEQANLFFVNLPYDDAGAYVWI